MARGAVVLVEEGRVALIRRERKGGSPYYLFPGGGIQEGESAEEAAMREAHEELGIRVHLNGLAAVVLFNGRTQHYYWATRISGVFGTGDGAEMTASAASSTGSYTPAWLALHELPDHDVRPRALADLVGRRPHPTQPMFFEDHG